MIPHAKRLNSVDIPLIESVLWLEANIAFFGDFSALVGMENYVDIVIMHECRHQLPENSRIQRSYHVGFHSPC
jgi:hypothetical protein